MAWRQIHDDVPVSKTLNAVSDFAERLYWRLLSQTDQWGRLPGDADKIRAQCVPMLDRQAGDIESALVELVRVRRIDLYFVDGERICELVDFDERQTAGKMKRKPSRFPGANASGKALENPRSTREDQSRADQRGKERTPEQTRETDPAEIEVAALVERSLDSGKGSTRPSRDLESESHPANAQESSVPPDETPGAAPANPDAVREHMPGAVSAKINRLIEVLPPESVKANTRTVLGRIFGPLPAHRVEQAREELLAAENVHKPAAYLVQIGKRMLTEAAR